MILRILLLPIGLLFRLFHLSLDGSRDIINRLKYKKSIVDNGCCITNSCRLSENVHILENSLLINTSIDIFSYVGRNCMIQNTTIGKYCSISNDVIIGLGKHPLNNFSTSPLFYKNKNTFNYSFVEKDSDFVEYLPIEIGNDVWIGTRVIIMDGVKIGNGAVIGSNSVVTKDVPDYGIVVGSPAKVIKFRFEKLDIEVLLKSKWWDLNHKELVEFENRFKN